MSKASALDITIGLYEVYSDGLFGYTAYKHTHTHTHTTHPPTHTNTDVSKASALDITIGPYEVYSDGLFGYKAAFRAFICVRDLESTKKLSAFSDEMQV